MEGKMKDIDDPEYVEIVIRNDGKVIWVNVENRCVLRCCGIKNLEIDDRRPEKSCAPEKGLGTETPFSCCRCGGAVEVVIEVRRLPALGMFKCVGSNWHGSWHDRMPKPEPQARHIICAACENALRNEHLAGLYKDASKPHQLGQP